MWRAVGWDYSFAASGIPVIMANPVNKLQKDGTVFLNAVGFAERLYRRLQHAGEAAKLHDQMLSERLDVLLRDCIGQKKLKHSVISS